MSFLKFDNCTYTFLITEELLDHKVQQYILHDYSFILSYNLYFGHWCLHKQEHCATSLKRRQNWENSAKRLQETNPPKKWTKNDNLKLLWSFLFWIMKYLKKIRLSEKVAFLVLAPLNIELCARMGFQLVQINYNTLF